MYSPSAVSHRAGRRCPGGRETQRHRDDPPAQVLAFATIQPVIFVLSVPLRVRQLIHIPA
jgi:hypothetical protein